MDHDTAHCRSCGHGLGIGRFCVNCGHPKDDGASTDPRTTAERPVVPVRPAHAAVAPPPVHQPPAPARYPLYADDPYSPTTGLPPLPAHATTTTTTTSRAAARRRSPAPLWAAVAVAVALLLGVGGAALLGLLDRPEPARAPVIAASPSPSRIPVPPRTEPAAPDPVPGESSGTDPAGGGVGPVDVARTAEATPPDTAAPSRDVRGNAVRYEAFNMLDGEADTAWRMPGDATGREIVVRLDAPTTVTAVGLVNGYAKIEPRYDGYAANRRITAVEWVFDDGTVVPQSLVEEPELQGVEVDEVTTSTITLRILEVTPPGPGADGRDYTAISDLAVVGNPA